MDTLRFVRVVADDGVGLEVFEAGDPAAPALLCVHGFGGAKEDFTEHADALAADHRFVAFDHRGHGASDKPADEARYSLGRFAADTIAVADALGVGRFRLMGTSMGGMVAQIVALNHADRVEALVLQDTWPGPLPFDKEGAYKAAALVRAEGLEELARRTAGRDALTTPAHERLLRERPGYQEFSDGKFFAQAPEMYAAIVVELFEQDDRTDALGDIRCPTLVMVGEQDAAAPDCRVIAETVPDAVFVEIPNAGHSPQFENPAVWLDTVTRFLRDLDR